MHLYLSSSLLGNRASELAPLVRTRKAAVVANALDNTEADVRRGFAHGQVEELRDLGFQAHELDLRDYFGTPDRLAHRLNDVGLVWVTGGNSFLLRRAMNQSGFDSTSSNTRAMTHWSTEGSAPEPASLRQPCVVCTW